MFRIVKTGYIDMAHRIRGHSGPCQNIHGHTWKIELSVSCEDDKLNDLEMVVDFSVLKQEFFRHIDACFDHTCLFGKDDWKALRALCEEPLYAGGTSPTFLKIQEALGVSRSTHCKPRLGLHAVNFNVSAERLAELFYGMALRGLESEGSRIKVDYVRVYEQLHPTESYAEYRPTEETQC